MGSKALPVDSEALTAVSGDLPAAIGTADAFATVGRTRPTYQNRQCF